MRPIVPSSGRCVWDGERLDEWEIVRSALVDHGIGGLVQKHEDFKNHDGDRHGENDQPGDIRDAVDDPLASTS